MHRPNEDPHLHRLSPACKDSPISASSGRRKHGHRTSKLQDEDEPQQSPAGRTKKRTTTPPPLRDLPILESPAAASSRGLSAITAGGKYSPPSSAPSGSSRRGLLSLAAYSTRSLNVTAAASTKSRARRGLDRSKSAAVLSKRSSSNDSLGQATNDEDADQLDLMLNRYKAWRATHPLTILQQTPSKRWEPLSPQTRFGSEPCLDDKRRETSSDGIFKQSSDRSLGGKHEPRRTPSSSGSRHHHSKKTSSRRSGNGGSNHHRFRGLLAPPLARAGDH